jgi:hypothetical protein
VHDHVNVHVDVHVLVDVVGFSHPGEASLANAREMANSTARTGRH